MTENRDTERTLYHRIRSLQQEVSSISSKLIEVQTEVSAFLATRGVEVENLTSPVDVHYQNRQKILQEGSLALSGFPKEVPRLRLLNLPFELLRNVLSYLQAEDLINFAKTCRSSFWLVEDRSLWNYQHRIRFPLYNVKTCLPQSTGHSKMQHFAKRMKVQKAWEERRFVSSTYEMMDKLTSIETMHVISLSPYVIATSGYFLCEWDYFSKRAVSVFPTPGRCIHASCNEVRLALATNSNHILVYETATKQQLYELQPQRLKINRLLLSKQYLVGGYCDGTLGVYDCLDGSSIVNMQIRKDQSIYSLGKCKTLIGAGFADGTISLWDLQQSQTVLTVSRGHRDVINAIEFIRSGPGASAKHFASASRDRSVCVWDIEKSYPLQTLSEHQGSVTCVKSEGFYKLMSGSKDGTIKLWDLRCGNNSVFTFTNAHHAGITSLYFDEYRILSGDDTGVIRESNFDT